jgi:hypothetical protein
MQMLSQSRGITSVVDHASFFNHHGKLQQPLSQLGGAIGVGAINLKRSLSCNLETGNNCDTTQLCRSLSSMDGVAFQDSEIQVLKQILFNLEISSSILTYFNYYTK